MAFVVTEPCRSCKAKQCVEVCPCDSFHDGGEMLYIDPDKCIDCAACVPECPVEAIFADDDVPEVWREWIERNAAAVLVTPQVTFRD